MPRTVHVHREKMRLKVLTLGWKRKFQKIETTPEVFREAFDWEVVRLLKYVDQNGGLEKDQRDGKTCLDAIYHNDKTG